VKKEDGVEFGVLRWTGGMGIVLGRFIFSANCGVAGRALDDKLRRIGELAVAGGDLKLQEKMTLTVRTEVAVGRSPSCAVAPIIMGEVEDEQRNSKYEESRCSSRALAQVPRIYGTRRGLPSASHDPPCLRLFWLIATPGLPQVPFL
jgi:hypothetical protein